MKTRISIFLTSLVIVVAIGWVARASDHDDGENDIKSRSLNLTDLFVFREDWHTGSGADSGKLVLIMNTNPRSLPQQQYYFSTNARYEFHIARVADKAKAYTNGDDVDLRFEFGPPSTSAFLSGAASHAQPITVTLTQGSSVSRTSLTTAGANLYTTPLGLGSDTVNTISLGGQNLRIFAGLKEDPFFFDVEQFFKVRAALAGSSGTSLGGGFRTPAAANDFAAGYNVNAIVVEVPIVLLQASASDTVFDVWETISVPH